MKNASVRFSCDQTKADDHEESGTTIPRIIHYCWFGGNPLPESAKKCIASWRKFFPGYEIIEWNEINYDVHKIPYTSQAYDAKKYAFVSDYARFDILYQHGGIYFDTDVEVVKPFDDILAAGPFMGCEIDAIQNEELKCQKPISELSPAINPGLGLAANPRLPLYSDVLSYYSDKMFVLPDGSLNEETIVHHVTRVLRKHGLKDTPGIQRVDGVTLYPEEYFNPLDSLTGELRITENTHSIHWYTMSWLSPRKQLRVKIGKRMRRLKKMFGRSTK